jgi:hypothetical protein
VTPETVALQYIELTLDSVAAEVAVTEEALRQHYEQIAPGDSSRPGSAVAVTS